MMHKRSGRAGGKYRTIVADPPWPIGDFPKWGKEEGRTPCPYPTMTVDEIAALNVKSISDNRDGDAHLYLWTTTRFLSAAEQVAESWGFKLAAVLVWCKPPHGVGLGGTFISNVEFILYCRRTGYTSVDKREPRLDIAAVTGQIGEVVAAAGITNRQINEWVGATDIASWWTSRLPLRCAIPKPEHWQLLKANIPALEELDDAVSAFNAVKGTTRKPPTPLPARLNTCWFTWPRGKHSAKPEAFIDMVEQVSPGPYLEMFARRQRLGWDTYGNECFNTSGLELPS